MLNTFKYSYFDSFIKYVDVFHIRRLMKAAITQPSVLLTG